MERISLCTEFIQRPAVGDVGLEARALALSIFAEGDPHTVAMESWLGGGGVCSAWRTRQEVGELCPRRASAQ